jgi:hypothetical protein
LLDELTLALKVLSGSVKIEWAAEDRVERRR